MMTIKFPGVVEKYLEAAAVELALVAALNSSVLRLFSVTSCCSRAVRCFFSSCSFFSSDARFCFSCCRLVTTLCNLKTQPHHNENNGALCVKAPNEYKAFPAPFKCYTMSPMYLPNLTRLL